MLPAIVHWEGKVIRVVVGRKIDGGCNRLVGLSCINNVVSERDWDREQHTNGRQDSLMWREEGMVRL